MVAADALEIHAWPNLASSGFENSVVAADFLLAAVGQPVADNNYIPLCI